jgi:NAD-dependent deacetylase
VTSASLQEVRAALKGARRVAALTGAGISAESGVPTFRGGGGLWRNRDAMKLATPEAFQADPELVWSWYDYRRGKVAECRPNPAHFALVAIERWAESFTLITQNVDGLHDQAGSKNVLELHGNLWKLRCTGCGIVRADRTHPLSLLPMCDSCGAMERPHIVWFGESLDAEILKSSARAAEAADFLLVVGTSAVVQPAASLAYLCKRNGGFVAVVNLEETAHTRDMNAALIGKAGEILVQLIEPLGIE